MGVFPFYNPGFLDGVWRPASEDSLPDHDFSSCRFGIDMHRGVDGLEPSGEDIRGLRCPVPRTCSTGYFRRFKGPPDGRWNGVGYTLDTLLLVCRHVCTVMNSSVFFFLPRLDPGKYRHTFRMMT
jgi:hypothetical protein